MGNNVSIIDEMFAGTDPEVLLMAYQVFEIEEDETALFDDEASEDQLNEIEIVKRALSWHRTRQNWNDHVEESIYDNSFHRKYRMSLNAFTGLVRILGNAVVRDMRMNRYGGFVCPEIVVGCALRYLAGGKYTYLGDIFGLSKTEVYKCRDDFLTAVLECKELDIKFPKDEDEWERVRAGFTNIATSSVHDGRCCGALDGFFQSTRQPSREEAMGNPKAFFSGHYLSYGLNCQALCDARLRFMYFAVIAPGKVNDAIAVRKCSDLIDAIKNLPFGHYMVGDAAYDLTDKLLTPFVGSQGSHPDRDAFNFYLSQLRIRIEMAFGRLANKWWILTTTLTCNLRTSSNILMACARLHNYVIDADDIFAEVDEPDDENDSASNIIRNRAPPGMSYLPTLPTNHTPIEQVTGMRDALVDYIHSKGYRRPTHNIERRTFMNLEQEYFTTV